MIDGSVRYKVNFREQVLQLDDFREFGIGNCMNYELWFMTYG